MKMGQLTAEGGPESTTGPAFPDKGQEQKGPAAGLAVMQYFGDAQRAGLLQGAQAVGFGPEHVGGMGCPVGFQEEAPLRGIQGTGFVDVPAGYGRTADNFGVQQASEGPFQFRIDHSLLRFTISCSSSR